MALDHLLLEHVKCSLHTFFGVRNEFDLLVTLPIDISTGVLEIEPLREFLLGLIQSVVDLHTVDLAHDVETTVGHTAPRVGERIFGSYTSMHSR